ncbi:MAG: bile acid:sodium symporter [Methylophaga sp.]|jgi:bile acid:Na+ symporter, BASS family|uniref:bile acid:sodium symporter family protein n=1 Tax=unclassified Methylophaga TaxID=2629249 RepID=UPI000C913CA7|nr:MULTISPECIES: bile acid:sodium symporter family protein [unclassified Methylophaga]MAK65593.1 bile acid:sodium symporter [Methylophaga sp.]MAY16316.1 bile acid:sodium symporter [Methylophaga sp.]HAO26012.1 bile acid:sodium symporter [Methylophaga sp.]HCD06075.1 bile acid:sodium symporter [Methylophaga sp.]|tara:strand:+ start:698 stop:1621 length:924 start_codon:yes stop_codon:yes gene_type:complete
MGRLIYFIESNLVWFVIIVAGIGLVLPETGNYLQPLIGLLLAALMFIISLTFDAHDVRLVLRKPSRQFLALVLVYGPMSLAGLLTGRLFFGSGPLAMGQTLLGTLPTDVSSPLLVLMARGNVALAAVFNAVNTALSPFIVPLLFLWLTGIQLEVPLDKIIFELVLIVLVPTILGVSLRTKFSTFFSRHDSAYAGIGSFLYLLILLAVIGPNAETIIGYGWYAFVIAAAALSLNLIGYLVGMTSRLITNDRKEVITYLFTVSKKEFSIAAAFVAASGLPSEIAIPAAFFAVIQMITSPIVAKILSRTV